jgi:hypothetical protein
MSGRPRGYAPWRPQHATQAVMDKVIEILDEYEDHLPLTVRQIFYRLVGAYGYEKTEKAYEALAEKLVRARRARLVDFDALRDDGVSVMRERWFAGAEDFWDDVARNARAYRRDKQAGQHVYIELWCEAAGMMAQLATVADEFSVPVFSAGGFSSLSAVRMIVDRVLSRSVPTLFLHVGDLDPSGESIFDSMTRDAIAFLEQDALLPGIHRLYPERVALTFEQVAEHELPTAPPKSTDSRSATWKGATCQVEALPPSTLAEIVRTTIAGNLNATILASHNDEERRERVQLLRALSSG